MTERKGLPYIQKIFALLLLQCFIIFPVVSQVVHSSKNNYTGNWESPETWIPGWSDPLTEMVPFSLEINGYITCNSSLSVFTDSGTLFVNDTLVVKGSILLANKSGIVIGNNGIVVVYGDLIIDNKASVSLDSGAYLIITGDFIKQGASNFGEFISENEPSNVFIGGTVTPGLDTNLYPVLICPGSYDSSGCSYGDLNDLENDSTHNFFVDLCVTTLPVITPGGNIDFCEGDSLVLTSSEAPGYLWSTSDTCRSITVDQTGNYSVRAIYAPGCISDSSVPVNVNVHSLPVAMVTIDENSGLTDNDGIVCQGDDVKLTASGGTNYLWSTGDTSGTLILDTSAVISVTVTNENGCSDTTKAVVVVNPLPQATIDITENSGIAENDGILCSGSEAMLTASGGTTYNWSSGQSTAVISVTDAANYSVTVTDANGCSDTTEATMIVHPVPEAVIVISESPENSGISADDGILCAGGQAVFTASGGIVYTWSSGQHTEAISVSVPGSYSVTVTNANGCSDTAETTLIVNPLPVAIIEFSDNSGTSDNDGIICNGDAVTLNAAGGNTYSWSSGQLTASVTVTTQGSYSVTVTDANGCSGEAEKSVIVNDNPRASISIFDNTGQIVNDGEICSYDSAQFSASGGITYLWSSGESSPVIWKKTSGDYTVTVTDANGCEDDEVATIQVIEAYADAGMDGETCGNEYRLGATLNMEDFGEWHVVSGAGNIEFNPSAEEYAAIAIADAPGLYFLTWNISGICTASDTVEILFKEVPDADAGPGIELNNVFTATMGASLQAGETGAWSLVSGTGDISDVHSPSATITGLSSGDNIFLWTVTSSMGCEASDQVVLTVSELFVPQVITPNNDGRNDFFVIEDIEENGPVHLIILNRWGNEVYADSNYQNDWDGKDMGGTDLSEDTYFYILKFPDSNPVSGFIIIKR